MVAGQKQAISGLGREERVGLVLDGVYRILRPLGHGSAGAVYLAHDLEFGRRVAVMLLRADAFADAGAAGRFVVEAQPLTRLQHANIVHTYRAGLLETGGAYLATEFVDGPTARQVLRKGGPLPLTRVLGIVKQVAGGLSAGHKHQIVHGNLTPENLLILAGQDGRHRVKVRDFGVTRLVARMLRSGGSGPARTVVSPAYSAPEQFLGGDVDARADVYALGVVMYELLAGRAPFAGSLQEIAAQHASAPPPPLTSYGVRVPASLERVLARALAKDRADRPVSPTEFVRELAAALAPPSAPSVAHSLPLQSEVAVAQAPAPDPDESGLGGSNAGESGTDEFDPGESDPVLPARETAAELSDAESFRPAQDHITPRRFGRPWAAGATLALTLLLVFFAGTLISVRRAGTSPAQPLPPTVEAVEQPGSALPEPSTAAVVPAAPDAADDGPETVPGLTPAPVPRPAPRGARARPQSSAADDDEPRIPVRTTWHSNKKLESNARQKFVAPRRAVAPPAADVVPEPAPSPPTQAAPREAPRERPQLEKVRGKVAEPAKRKDRRWYNPRKWFGGLF